MTDDDRADLAALVRPDRVHRRIYTDPGIFAREMERIFARAWLYIGHESQVARPGDFFATRMGRRPVLLTRERDGTLHLLFNQCAHRGAMPCLAESGNTQRLRCPYHGWTYALDGRLVGVPLKRGYADDFDFDDPALSLGKPPRMSVYRGFVFASLAVEGPDLADSHGPILSALDNMVDRAPGGAVHVVGAPHRHVFRANWKMQLENLQDAAHPGFVHESSIAAARLEASETREMRADDVMSANADAARSIDAAGVHAFPGGHGYMGGLPVQHVASAQDRARYAKALAERHGDARAREILAVDRHQNILYPNMTVQAVFQTVKVVFPLAADLTEVHAYAFGLDGAPAAYARASVQFLDIANSSASPVLTDDLEVYESAQAALAGAAKDWVVFAAGLDTDVAANDGGRRGRGLSELAMRNQFAAWRDFMLAPATAAE